MSVAVLVPYRGSGCLWRERARIHVRAHYAAEHPDWQWVEGTCEGEWSKGTAVADALTRTDADMLVIADADVIVAPDALRDAVSAAENGGSAIPHQKVYRLSQGATEAFYAGQHVREWDRNPYRGVQGGGLVALTREVYEDCPMDPRFLGWGGEDVSWALALYTLHGRWWRGEADLTHLWHPSARIGRVGGPASSALASLYSRALNRPARMRPLVEEAKCSLATSSPTP